MPRPRLALVSHQLRQTREVLKSLTLFKLLLIHFDSQRALKMNARSIKLIKRHERVSRRPALVKLTAGPNRWSTAVRSWIVEFQERDRTETLPAFDNLFKDDLSDPANTA